MVTHAQNKWAQSGTKEKEKGNWFMQLSSLAFCNDPGLASFAIGRDLQGKIITKGMSVGLLLILPVSEKSDSFHSFTFFKKGDFSFVLER